MVEVLRKFYENSELKDYLDSEILDVEVQNNALVTIPIFHKKINEGLAWRAGDCVTGIAKDASRTFIFEPDDSSKNYQVQVAVDTERVVKIEFFEGAEGLDSKGTEIDVFNFNRDIDTEETFKLYHTPTIGDNGGTLGDPCAPNIIIFTTGSKNAPIAAGGGNANYSVFCGDDMYAIRCTNLSNDAATISTYFRFVEVDK